MAFYGHTENNQSMHPLLLTSTLAAAALCGVLTACDGAANKANSKVSDNATTRPTANPQPRAGSQASDSSVAIVTTAPPAAGYSGEELGAYRRLNTARVTCGFGYLRQNKRLDTAAGNHVSWMLANARYAHAEVAGTAAFTGVDASDRLPAAGYALSGSWGTGEIIDELPSSNKTGFGSAGINNLLGAPYHLLEAMSSAREMGVSVKSGGPSGADFASASKVSYIVVNLAYAGQVLPQLQNAKEVLTYPCQGITGTNWQLQGEFPSPVPSRNLGTSPIGQPIFVQVLEGNKLTIASASVVGPLGAVALLPTMTRANDPNAELGSHQAIVMPNAPLKPNTSYSVSISGSNSGVAFRKSFSFQTGS